MVKSYNLNLYSPNEQHSSKIALLDSSITETNTLNKTVLAPAINVKKTDSNGDVVDEVLDLVNHLVVEKARLDTVENTATTESSRIDTLENQMTVEQSNVDTLQSEMITERGRIDTLNTTMAAEQGFIDTLQGEIVTERSRIDGILNGADINLNTLKEITDYVDAEDNSINSLLTALTDRVTAAENQLAELTN